MSRILQFLRGFGTDNDGRKLADILAMSDDDLERDHAYIQWLFPLKEPSGAVLDSPILTSEDVRAVRDNPNIQENIQKSLVRIGTFYEQTNRWLRRNDHNHLRITRIIKSVRLLLSEDEASRFYRFIMKRVRSSGNRVRDGNIAYWRQALNGDRKEI